MEHFEYNQSQESSYADDGFDNLHYNRRANYHPSPHQAIVPK
jgi:hypothetical protein